MASLGALIIALSQGRSIFKPINRTLVRLRGNDNSGKLTEYILNLMAVRRRVRGFLASYYVLYYSIGDLQS
jgi:hypothetical protein